MRIHFGSSIIIPQYQKQYTAAENWCNEVRRIEIAHNLAAIFRTMKLSTLNIKTPPQTSIKESLKSYSGLKISMNWFFCISKTCKQMFFVLIQQTFSTLLIFSIQYLFLDIF